MTQMIQMTQTPSMTQTPAMTPITQLPRPHPVMAALADGCPLSLLIDLTDSLGPDSKLIMAREHADMSWLRGLRQTTDRPTVSGTVHQAR
jgi:hypothetical protein